MSGLFLIVYLFLVAFFASCVLCGLGVVFLVIASSKGGFS